MSNRELYPDAFSYFEKHAQWLGGTTYYILFEGKEFYSNDTLDLFNKFKEYYYNQIAHV